jgi:hypothetical protein
MKKKVNKSIFFSNFKLAHPQFFSLVYILDNTLAQDSRVVTEKKVEIQTQRFCFLVLF